jgi:2-succinyl-5-enolpyruvyl-6-hydroxy-3-cyclohexene-1-carboxylate synthase
MSRLPQQASVAQQNTAVRALVAALRAVRAGPFVISPGSRSTPLVQALAQAPELQLVPVLDERSAGFVAVGLARAGRRPVVVTTSGSAVAHLLPAWVEAGESALGVGALTADRPVAVRGLGAPQTVWQVGMLEPYADTIDFDAAAGDPAEFERQLHAEGARLAGPWQRPWHWNVALDQPLALDSLVAETSWPSGFAPPTPPAVVPLHPEPLSQAIVAPPAPDERVLVVAGPRLPHDTALLTQWLAQSPALCAVEVAANLAPGGLRQYDTWLRDPALLAAFLPDRIVRLGHWPVAKGLQLLLEHAERVGIAVDVIAPGRPSDPQRQARVHTSLPATMALREWPAAPASSAAVQAWRQHWLALDAAAGLAWAPSLDGPLHELRLLPDLLAAIPLGARLVVGNSMPIRDVDAAWSGGVLPCELHVARGANGIDGTLAQAIGLALADPTSPVWVYLGDSTFLHDIGTLQLLSQPLERAPMVVVVADNAGGVIFDYLPAAQVVEPWVHERFFTVPHGLNLVAVASGFGLPTRGVATVRQWQEALADLPQAGPTQVLVLAIDAVVSKQAHQSRQTQARTAATDHG